MGFFVLTRTNFTNHACVPCLRRSGFAQAGITTHSGVQADSRLPAGRQGDVFSGEHLNN
jgi:hypothetical protein